MIRFVEKAMENQKRPWNCCKHCSRNRFYNKRCSESAIPQHMANNPFKVKSLHPKARGVFGCRIDNSGKPSLRMAFAVVKMKLEDP